MTRKPGAAETKPAAVPLSTVFCADNADVVIRAAGTLDFRAHKLILSFASPIFKDMFTLPQSDTSGTLPHVDVTESPKTWETILRTIYHLQTPVVDDLGDLGPLLAAKKYEMQFILDSNQGIFRDRGYIQRDPLHLYAIACACGLEDQAKYVARNAEHLAVTRRSNAGNLEGLTVTFYHRLVSFLAERDTQWHEIIGKAAISRCDCDAGTAESLYTTVKENLKKPSLQPEEVYLKALEERAPIRRSCGNWPACLLRAGQIKAFIDRMVKEREALCDKFMW